MRGETMMKLFESFALCGLLAATSVAPAATLIESIHVHVPFAFSFAGRDFAPGEYYVDENSDGTIYVHGTENGAYAISIPLDATALGSAPRLEFANTGIKAYLMKVEGEGTSRLIPFHSEAKKTASH